MFGGADFNPVAVRHARRACERATTWAARNGHPDLAVEYDALPRNVQHLVGLLATHLYKCRSALERGRN